jgi:cytochrome c-type biogenesis protein CcmF
VVFGVGVIFFLPQDTGDLFYVALGLGLAMWVALSHLVGIRERLRNKRNLRSMLSDLNTSRSYYGMLLAHVGVAVFVVGITMVTHFDIEKDVRMSPGDVVEEAGYHFEFMGAQVVPGPNFQSQRGHFKVYKDDRLVTELWPEKRTYFASRQTMTEASIDAGLFRDLYVSLGEPVGTSGDWALRVYYKPYVRWIWLGSILMGLGGFLAVSDRRYRTARKAVTLPAGAVAARG